MHEHDCYNKEEEAMKISKTWLPALEMCTVKLLPLSKNITAKIEKHGAITKLLRTIESKVDKSIDKFRPVYTI